jgi:cytochrome P450
MNSLKIVADLVPGCIGYQLAQIELALAATLFFREFPCAAISSIMTEKDMELEDKFVMNPRGQKCLVILE